jgi:OOP family OmpA-OmpF porin
MKPSPWPVFVLVLVFIAALWWFWPRDKQDAVATGDGGKTVATATTAGAAATPASSSTASTSSASAAPVAAAAAAPPPQPEEPLVAKVYFDFDRASLRPGDSPKLDALAAKLKDRKYARVTVVGHADRIGEAPHNDALSRKRADAAAAYLASKGVDAARAHAEGKGESDTAIADGCKDMGPERGDNEKLVGCLQEDRRVDVAVVIE